MRYSRKGKLTMPNVGLGIIIFVFISTALITLPQVHGHENIYSEKANVNLIDLKEPFRMAKLNLLWEKARKRLSEPKLNKLLSELKVQDIEELTLKKLKSSGGDKEGLKEAELRNRLKKISTKFALENHAEKKDEKDMNKKIEKAVFKDKKLHKLWLKAEQSGLSQEELKALREEFQHHQEKIDEYFSMIEQASSSPNDIPDLSNDVNQFEDLHSMEGSAKDYEANVNAIRERHRELKNDYNVLHKKATSGPDSKEFIDPKVSGLWKLALRSDFDTVELESLYTELKHYETRLQKLSFLSNEINKMTIGKLSDELSEDDREKILRSKDTEGKRILEERLQKQRRKTEKLHEDLELRIMARHSEL